MHLSQKKTFDQFYLDEILKQSKTIMNPQKKMVYVQRILNPAQSRSNGMTSFNKDNFLRVMTESIDKALSSSEAPVKEKHIRRLLIGSHQAENGLFFWNNLHVTKLQENQIVCWKFCFVLHKMLRDGHKQVLSNSYNRRQVLLDCGNMWRHVEDGYGKLIFKYCTLLYNRISFLARNTCFPNDLKLSDKQLEDIGGSELGVFFQLSCELFDSLDDILTLQETVLAAVDLKKLNSMTNAGRCHLSPLLACIQDSSMLYDYIVKILFKLHNGLPSSTLEGHRDRFNQQHKSLKNFYINTSNLQFFKTLIQIPHLNERPPNFLIASDLQQHVTPKVVMILGNERESPDQSVSSKQTSSGPQQLVDLDDDARYRDFDDQQYAPSQSSIYTSPSQDRFFSHDQPDSSTVFDGIPEFSSLSTVTDQSGRIKELEEYVEQLQKELQLERSYHEESRKVLGEKVAALEQSNAEKLQELQQLVSKTKEELAKSRHQLQITQMSLSKVQEDCERAEHDSEIRKDAMKKLVKELADLRSQRIVPNNHSLINKEEDDATKRLIKELHGKLEKQENELKEKNELEEKWRIEKEILNDSKLKLERQLENKQEDLLMAEMDETDKILKEASRKIEELNEKSRRLESGIKLQVNEKIAEVCSNLMKSVRNLIVQSRFLQREIVGNDNQTSSNIEFYQRNSSWTEGLISAANVVAMAAKSLVDSADMAMSGRAKFSELAAAAHEVAAATTQLVVASRVKANRDSEKLKILTGVAKQVNQCTSNIVDTARVCAELIEQEIDKVDISSLSLHQTKKLEMETQVRLLELEDQLSKERIKLGLLRRQHYEQEEKVVPAASQK